MPDPAPNSPEQEGRFLHYVGNQIPWFVHVLWVGFWIGAIAYIALYLVPIMKVELLSPP